MSSQVPTPARSITEQRVEGIGLLFHDYQDGKMPWVLYENGSFVGCYSSSRLLDRNGLIKEANQVMRENATNIGTYTADTRMLGSKVRVAEGPMYVILHGEGNILSLEILQSVSENTLPVCLAARRSKDLDIQNLRVVATSKD